MVDYSNFANRNEFLTAYEKSKVTINIAVRSNCGRTTGDDFDEAYNLFYLCDENILTEYDGDNNLQYQQKIVLKQVAGNTYKVVKVVYDTGNRDEDNPLVDDASSSTDVTLDWTHAITIVYPIDIVSLYGDIEGKYITIPDEKMTATIPSGDENIDQVNEFIARFKDQPYTDYTEATIVDVPSNVWSGSPVRTLNIANYVNFGGANGQNYYYLCDNNIVSNNSLRYQYKILLQYDSNKHAYKIVLTDKATAGINTAANNAHAIANPSYAFLNSITVSVGQYIVFTVLDGDILPENCVNELLISLSSDLLRYLLNKEILIFMLKFTMRVNWDKVKY